MLALTLAAVILGTTLASVRRRRLADERRIEERLKDLGSFL